MRIRRGVVAGALCSLFAVMMVAPSGTAWAASFTVNSTEDRGDASLGDGACDADPDPGVTKCTLRAAIGEGETLGGPTTITLPGGTYSTTSNFLSTQAFTVNGAGEAGTEVVGPIGAPQLTMSNLTVRGVSGICAVGGVLTLTNVTVRDNSTCGISMGLASRLTSVTVSGNGVGIMYGGQPTISDSTIRDNQGIGLSGSNDGSSPSHLTMTNVTVSGNQGGGIFGAHLTLDNVTVDRNRKEGHLAVGGIIGMVLSLTNVRVTNNTVSNPGGVVSASGVEIVGASSLPPSTLDRVTISDNSGATGLLIGGSGVRATITGSTISGTTGGRFGGVYVAGGTVTIQDSAVTGNRATDNGGGIFNGGTLTLTGVTVSGNGTTAGAETASGGGGIYSPGRLTMTGGSISTNSAANAGGLYSEGNLTLTNVNVVSNTALLGDRPSGVGGIVVRGAFVQVAITGGSVSNNTGAGLSIQGGTTPRIEGVTIADNSQSGLDLLAANVTTTVLRATIRGNGENGFVVLNGTLELRDSTVSGNSTSVLGGGAAVAAGTAATLVNTTISGNHATNGAFGGGIANGGRLTLENVTVSDNDASGGGAQGGGIYNAGRLTMTGGAVRHNTAPKHGGIYNRVEDGSNPSMTLTNVAVEDNWALEGAGGISNEGTATLQNVTVAGNDGDEGGGIANAGGLASMTMTGGAIRNNLAGSYGGIANLREVSGRPSLTLNEVPIEGNLGLKGAGGIHNLDGFVQLNRLTISDNTGDYGGMLNFGLISSTVNARLTNVTISGNKGTGLVALSVADLVNVTIASNTAPAGEAGGILTSGTARLKNTIVANNSGVNCVGGVETRGNNLDSDNSCGLQVSQGDLPGRDPRLGPLANNGGATKTHALLASSPAIEGGTNTGCPATDQRGTTRPQGARCDIGAFEAPPGSGGPSCEQRPPVGVQTSRTNDGRLQVTIRSNTSPTMPENQLQGLNFTRLDNARVTAGVQTITGPQNVPLTGRPQETTFFVSRVTAGQPTTVHFQVSDGCPTSWPTFVGGGGGAF